MIYLAKFLYTLSICGVGDLIMPPKVDQSKCNGCGNCVEVCPGDPPVFELKDEKSHVVHPDECVDCESCVDECPEGAITMEES
jgi:NAD-dependent dihydropyrimidine dehydrogenase PreA subunit